MKLKLFFGFLIGFGFAFLLSLGLPSPRPDVTYTTPIIKDSVLPNDISDTRPKSIRHIDLPVSRTIYLYGEVNHESATTTIQNLNSMESSNEPIYLVLDSPGGSVIDGASIVTAIEAAQGPVYTVCNQLCASMAAIIFEYGTKRYMLDRTFLMFHPAALGGVEGEVDKVVSELLALQKYIGRMEMHIAGRAAIGFKEYKDAAAKGVWIDSDDAILRGYADGVVSASLSAPQEQPTPTSKFNIFSPDLRKFKW